MMKKLLFTLILFAFTTLGFAQITYYWVGGANGTWSTSSSWNTTLGGSGSGSERSTAATTDVLIFDGGNIGSGATGTVTPAGLASSATQNPGKLILQNGADIVIQRATSSTGSININGGVGDDFLIDATSAMKITSFTSGGGLNFVMAASTTGQISGALSIIDGGLGTVRINTVLGGGIISFLSGSKCYINNSTSGDYPFGAVTAPNVSFQSGSTCYFQGGLSPFSQTNANFPVEFLNGSNFELQAPISTTSNVFSKHKFGNVIISNNAIIDLDGYFYNIDNLTVNSGSAFNLSTTGGHPISGNIVNNGSIGARTGYTSTNLLMVNTAPKTIGGSGTFNDIGSFTLAADAEVTLLKNIIIGGGSTSSILGKLNIGTNTINSVGPTIPGDINIRSAATATTGGNLTAGSNSITLNSVAYATGINTANVLSGALVSGTGIPSNTYIIGTSSSTSTITISKPVTLTTTSYSTAITISNNSATIASSNTAGIDGGFTTTGLRTFGTGINYIFNAATTAPFSTSSNNAIGNVIFNGAATTNKSFAITGVLTLNNVKLTVRAQDSVKVSSTGTFAGISNSSYLALDRDISSGKIGTLTKLGLNANSTFPVGTITNYLPVTLTPLSLSDFSINVFQGATIDATPNGTTIADKTKIVDAIWNVNRTSGAGDCVITLAWPAVLEGSDFLALTDSQIGISTYTGSAYSSFIGSGSQSANTATQTLSAFGPLSVGKIATLPVKLISFTAMTVNNNVSLNWQATSEVNLSNYVVERSTNGQDFETLASIKAKNSAGIFDYNYIDYATKFGVNYYRLLSVDIDGTTSTSNPVAVTLGASIASVTAYPNPTVNQLNVAGLVAGDHIKLLDLSGRIIKTQDFSGSSAAILNLDKINAGLYLLVVENAGKLTFQSKIVKN